MCTRLRNCVLFVSTTYYLSSSGSGGLLRPDLLVMAWFTVANLVSIRLVLSKLTGKSVSYKIKAISF